jgi:hypothetical protein
MMNRPDLIIAYNNCPENTIPSDEIAYNSKKKVKLLLEETEQALDNLTTENGETGITSDTSDLGLISPNTIEIYEPLCKLTKGIMTGEGISEQLESRVNSKDKNAIDTED